MGSVARYDNDRPLVRTFFSMGVVAVVMAGMVIMAVFIVTGGGNGRFGLRPHLRGTTPRQNPHPTRQNRCKLRSRRNA